MKQRQIYKIKTQYLSWIGEKFLSMLPLPHGRKMTFSSTVKAYRHVPSAAISISGVGNKQQGQLDISEAVCVG